MRVFCATAALCLAVLAPFEAHASLPRHNHESRVRPVPLPSERPDITSMFTILQRGRPSGPDGIGDRVKR